MNRRTVKILYSSLACFFAATAYVCNMAYHLEKARQLEQMCHTTKTNLETVRIAQSLKDPNRPLYLRTSQQRIPTIVYSITVEPGIEFLPIDNHAISFLEQYAQDLEQTIRREKRKAHFIF